eukprot:9477217-Pyramimonas_sp.AAC.2
MRAMPMLLDMVIMRGMIVIMRRTAVMIRVLGYALDVGYDIRGARASIVPLGHSATATDDPRP